MKWLNNFFDRVNPRIVEANELLLHKAGQTSTIIEVKWSDGTFSQYKGSGTVWRSYPMMKRCGTHMDRVLTDINKYLQEHGNPYPTAHES